MKAIAAARDIPVIMISALDELASVVRCIERGAEDYLPKPFDPVLLRRASARASRRNGSATPELEYLAQVGRVIEAATAVEAGRTRCGSLARVARRADEFGRLARVFDGMAAQVRAREERLREQVRALRGARSASRARAAATASPNATAGARRPASSSRIDSRYRVDRRGGMGTVYRARDRELGEDSRHQDPPPGAAQRRDLVDASSTRSDSRAASRTKTSSARTTSANGRACTSSRWNTCRASPCASCSTRAAGWRLATLAIARQLAHSPASPTNRA